MLVIRGFVMLRYVSLKNKYFSKQTNYSEESDICFTVRRVIFVLQSLQFFLMVGIRGLDFLYLLLYPVCFTITCLGKTLVYIHERMKVKKANNVLV